MCNMPCDSSFGINLGAPHGVFCCDDIYFFYSLFCSKHVLNFATNSLNRSRQSLIFSKFINTYTNTLTLTRKPQELTHFFQLLQRWRRVDVMLQDKSHGGVMGHQKLVLLYSKHPAYHNNEKRLRPDTINKKERQTCKQNKLLTDRARGEQAAFSSEYFLVHAPRF